MKLSISNIAWDNNNDNIVYQLMNQEGFSGLEIAPTRLFEDPYEHVLDAIRWRELLPFDVPSMQSIWFGKKEKIFGSTQERRYLINYTRKAVDFASAIGCRNIVFGCPQNRTKPNGTEEQIGIDFFKEIAEYAEERNTIISIEANPVIYNTNYINDTLSALDLINKVNSNSFRLNLDLGTMIYNSEPIELLHNRVHLINHIHISEPGLKLIKKRKIHHELKMLLLNEYYDRFVSIEMSKQNSIETLHGILSYIKDIFHD